MSRGESGNAGTILGSSGAAVGQGGASGAGQGMSGKGGSAAGMSGTAGSGSKGRQSAWSPVPHKASSTSGTSSASGGYQCPRSIKIDENE
jgi:hypothetical protein